ncbi:MAG: lipid A biosynthesis acyltransferase [Rhodomicrobium sp.]|nr:lipid A biosynthesis acyltransferase [Rhodomicrobium sp.]
MLLDLRQRLEYGILLAIVFFIRAMPLSMAAAFSARTWRFIAPKTRRHRRALKNLAKAMPEKTPAEREAIALGMWDNLGRVMAETFQLDRILEDPSRIEFENPALIDRYKDKMGAVVIAGPQMGSGEIGILPALAINSHPAGVYRLVENPYVDRFLWKKRSVLYPGGLFASKSDAGLATVMRISQHLRGGGALGMLADLADWSGVEVPFFGHMMWATTAPAWLARRAGTRLWVGRCIRVGKESRFKLAFKELKVPRTDRPDEDIRALTAEIQRHFEAWIREHPEQWMWSNKRWKDRDMPGGTQY